jgi:hypothetical protein
MKQLVPIFTKAILKGDVQSVTELYTSSIQSKVDSLTFYESVVKPAFARIIHKELSGKMEVNLKKESSFELVDLFYQFSDVQQRFHMAVISKDNEYQKVSQQMNGLFDRLGESNIIRKDTNHREVLASVSSLYMKLSNTSDWNREEVMDKVKEIEILLMKNVQ